MSTISAQSWSIPDPDTARPGASNRAGRAATLRRRCRGGLALRAGLAIVLAASAGATAARADLKMCNATASRVGVAVGYKGPDGWATEGWWNIGAQSCETLLRGAMPSRFLYVFAIDYDRGGEWAGTNFMCTQDASFLIQGVQDCSKRGYKRSGFFEVDTGDAREWTIRLTDPETGSQRSR